MDSAAAFLRKHAPRNTVVVVAHRKGAFEVAYKGFARKSYAWTRRGMVPTVAMVLIYLWSLHEELTLEAPPFDMAKVRAAACEAA